MSKLTEAKSILQALGLPPAQAYNEMACFTLLALAGVKPTDSWKEAKRSRTSVSKGVMTFVRDHYGKDYAENTRETFRRQVLHQFVQAHLAEYNPHEPNLATNSPRAHYALHEDMLPVLHVRLVMLEDVGRSCGVYCQARLAVFHLRRAPRGAGRNACAQSPRGDGGANVTRSPQRRGESSGRIVRPEIRAGI